MAGKPLREWWEPIPRSYAGAWECIPESTFSPQKLRFRPAEQAIASLIIHFVSLHSCPYAHALANRINGGVKNP